jgi:O-antigen ligase
VALVAGPVAGAVVATDPRWGPLILAAVGAVTVLGWAGVRCARALGVHGMWMALLLLSILMGQMGSLGAEGQSGRVLWADAVIGIGVVCALVRGRMVVRVPDAPFLRALIPFLAWGAASMLVARDPLTAIAEFKEWMAALIVAIAAANYASDAARARRLLGIVAITAALMSVHMLLVALTSPVGPIAAIMLKVVDLPWGRTNYLAGHLILAIPIAIGLIGQSTQARERVGWTAVLVVTFTGLVLSMSRGGILGLLVALVVAFGLERRQAAAPRLIVLALIGVAVLLYAVSPLRTVLAERLGSASLNYSASERLDMYRLAWQQFVEHPVFGIGINNFSVVAHQLRGMDNTPHNFELGYLVELGIPGLLLALGWALALGRTAWRARSASAGEARTLGLGLWAAFIGFMVQGQVEPNIYGQQFKMLLVTVAAATWRLAVEWEQRRMPEPSAAPSPRGSLS